MATQTETYKFNKPARTDRVNIEDLNENFDIIEEELKKRPLSSDTAGVTYYDLDLTSVVTVKSSDNELTDGGEHFDITSIVDAEQVMAAINNGKVVRIFFNDGFFPSRVVSVLLTDVYLGGSTDDTLAYLGAIYTNMYTERYAKIVVTVQCADEVYQVSFRYARDPGGTVKTVNGIEPDENGNVEVPTAEGTVKFVNGVAPDESGNAVLLSTTGLSIDWTNGTYTETLSDGTSHTEDIEFGTDGVPTKFGSMSFSITGG